MSLPQVVAKQAIEDGEATQIEQQVPQIGMGQIACYDPPPFALGDQGPIEGELKIGNGKEE